MTNWNMLLHIHVRHKFLMFIYLPLKIDITSAPFMKRCYTCKNVHVGWKRYELHFDK